MKTQYWLVALFAIAASLSRCSCEEEEVTDLTCTLECYTGPSDTEGVGICQVGINICDEEGKVIGCSDVVPQEEICDGLDNDCDREVDEISELPCRTLPEEISGVGICHPGVKKCINGRYSECLGEGQPEEEICDGLDNDCDGAVDNIVSERCGLSPNVGECQEGETACDNNETVCRGEIMSQEEICDGLDNDCDGEVDEDLEIRCYSDTTENLAEGACAVGVSQCENGVYGPCTEEVVPIEEICNEIDDNCDGFIDNLTQDGPCDYGGVGEACLNGTMVCVDGAPTCVPPLLDEEICDNVDNDCNGIIDDGLEAPCYSGPPETLNVGECREGVSVCVSGQWSECSGEVRPEREICDRLDNDCDGAIDSNVIFCGDIAVFVDQSGSSFDDLPVWKPALQRMADILCPEARLHLVGMPIDSYGVSAVHLNAGDPQAFRRALFSLFANRADNENQYGAIYTAIPETNQLALTYRPLEECETPPFCRKFIMFTDECPQYDDIYCISDATSIDQSKQIALAQALADFDVALYVFAPNRYWLGWRLVVYGLTYNVGAFYDLSSDENTTFRDLKDALLVDCSLVSITP